MQQTIPANEKQKIIKALEDKQALLPCPRCHKQKFTLLDGYFNQPIQQNLQNFNLAGPSLPSAVIVCENCGYMSQHALGVLDLIPKKSD